MSQRLSGLMVLHCEMSDEFKNLPVLTNFRSTLSKHWNASYILAGLLLY